MGARPKHTPTAELGPLLQGLRGHWNVLGGRRHLLIASSITVLALGTLAVLMDTALAWRFGHGVIASTLSLLFFGSSTLAGLRTIANWVEKKRLAGDFGRLRLGDCTLVLEMPHRAPQSIALEPGFTLRARYFLDRVHRGQAEAPELWVGTGDSKLVLSCRAVPHQRVAPSLGLQPVAESDTLGANALAVLPMDFLEILASLRRIESRLSSR